MGNGRLWRVQTVLAFVCPGFICLVREENVPLTIKLKKDEEEGCLEKQEKSMCGCAWRNDRRPVHHRNGIRG
jgi:hypothetical protein